MQRYRSGHNGADSKSVCGQPHEGSNPSRCATADSRFLLSVFYVRCTVFSVLAKQSVHGVRRGLLRRVVKVCVDVRRGGERTMSQPYSDLLHGDTVAEKQAGIRRECRFCLGHFPELPVKALDRIGRIDQAAYLLGVLEIAAQVGPILPPGPSDLGVFSAPALRIRKGIQSIQRSSLIDCGIPANAASMSAIRLLCKSRQAPVSDNKSCERRSCPASDAVPALGSSAFPDCKDILLQTL